MANRDIIVLNTTQSRAETQQGSDTVRIKGEGEILSIENSSASPILTVQSNGSQTTLESGYSWVVDWKHDFIGKEKLISQKESDYASLSGILLEERGVLRPGLTVFFDGIPRFK